MQGLNTATVADISPLFGGAREDRVPRLLGLLKDPHQPVGKPGTFSHTIKILNMDKAIVHPNFAKPPDKDTSFPSPTTTQTLNNKSSSSSTIQYDHETYLELLAGQSNLAEKTASQIYEEERARELSLRAQDPAVLSGPLDLEADVYRYEVGDGSKK
ncbi:conserved hypothetical protein [Talaromyces stipitatus ATCC 10500]|uniref:Uncharacterized protein n=1 Tax=Talaromyces stipitatus (strain ATCC 10500 / CBS 375.48 / QM 6759 / NRRL 1006) TaxID=441959 RepID=B8LXN1_TALSN|nr:uncharacterized protein TSTA_078870 [Talaromyces stipitatus ATCC 10500]EED24532.1 conserved hypothetical protein [Talaromyces stipitatus ATCC 10500]